MLSDITIVRLNRGFHEEVTHSFFILKGELNIVRKSQGRSVRFNDIDEDIPSEVENPVKSKWHLELNEYNEDIEISALKDTIAVYFGKVGTNLDSKEKYKQSMLFKNSFLIMNNARQVEAKFEDIDRQSIRASFGNMRPTTRMATVN